MTPVIIGIIQKNNIPITKRTINISNTVFIQTVYQTIMTSQASEIHGELTTKNFF